MLKKSLIIICAILILAVVCYTGHKIISIYAKPLIQIIFNYEGKENGVISVKGDYFNTNLNTSKDDAVKSTGIREIVEGKDYWGQRFRKGIYTDDISKSTNYDCQYLRYYDEADHSYYFILNTKAPIELIVEGLPDNKCIFLDITNKSECRKNHKVFKPGFHKVKISKIGK
jgi:hypothetical protein